ncbi:MAG: transcriptional regulator, TetR family [Amycolatopsis sp.]|uniref:TetR/AcrR family transcriptional regulator n=1 Tax=Amycolatopsis sp. TaxID=37632 RepID=UPI0026019FF5|nr:TetR/AcrR family transcriptional regulator [Amycolatopsis sp.]MCU1681149.1 transcriptional regulator, TetR family [Amycolatopsis sp.]
MTAVLSPRDRLLDTATRLFYAEGIHMSPVDKLITEAGVTRSTFYRHFPTKEDLVVAYVRAKSAEVRGGFEASNRSLRAVLEFIGDFTCSPGFRGCPFLNAAAEYPDPAHPVHVAVTDHRRWFRAALTELATELGHPDPDYAASILVMFNDGALVGGELDDAVAVSATLLRGGLALVRTAG